MTLQAIKYHKGQLQILDQLLLPDTTQYIDIGDTDQGWKAIKEMQVMYFVVAYALLLSLWLF